MAGRLLTVLCAATLVASAFAKPRVAVSIPPQAHFVEQVAGDLVDVFVLVDAGSSPHAFEPTARQMAAFSKASIYFTIGVDFENGVAPRLQRMFPDLQIVSLRQNVPLRVMEHDHHHHEPGHVCSAGAEDPHIWLSPRLVKIQAQTIHDALVRLLPRHKEQLGENLQRFHAELDGLHEYLRQKLEPYAGHEVFVFHPAFGYLLDELGLRQRPVEIEGKEPSARQLAALIETARDTHVQVVFVQPQFSERSAATLADAIGGIVVEMDPLARDYFPALRDKAAKIRAALDKQQATEVAQSRNER